MANLFRVPLDPIFTPGEIYTPPLPSPLPLPKPPPRTVKPIISDIINKGGDKAHDIIKNIVGDVKLPTLNVNGGANVTLDKKIYWAAAAVFGLFLLSKTKTFRRLFR